MQVQNRCGPQHFRVWIVAYRDWQPEHHGDIPSQATALEPAEPRAMTARQARRYVAAFNRAALARRKQVWAVALPVTLAYQGDIRPGTPLTPADLSAPNAHTQAL
jgi:hypothetical protein